MERVRQRPHHEVPDAGGGDEDAYDPGALLQRELAAAASGRLLGEDLCGSRGRQKTCLARVLSTLEGPPGVAQLLPHAHYLIELPPLPLPLRHRLLRAESSGRVASAKAVKTDRELKAAAGEEDFCWTHGVEGVLDLLQEGGVRRHAARGRGRGGGPRAPGSDWMQTAC